MNLDESEDNILNKDEENAAFSPTPMMLINDCSRLFGRQMRRHSDEQGFPNGYRELLMKLAYIKRIGNEGIAQNELAKITHLSPPTVSATVEKMERDGYITREPGTSDARRMMVKLTDRGYALDVENQEYGRLLEERAFADLSEHECAELKIILTKIRDALVDIDGEHRLTEWSERKETN